MEKGVSMCSHARLFRPPRTSRWYADPDAGICPRCLAVVSRGEIVGDVAEEFENA